MPDSTSHSQEGPSRDPPVGAQPGTQVVQVFQFFNNFDMGITNRNTCNHSTNEHYTTNINSNNDASFHSYDSCVSFGNVDPPPPPFRARRPTPIPTGHGKHPNYIYPLKYAMLTQAPDDKDRCTKDHLSRVHGGALVAALSSSPCIGDPPHRRHRPDIGCKRVLLRGITQDLNVGDRVSSI
jgi:hypothetical protein